MRILPPLCSFSPPSALVLGLLISTLSLCTGCSEQAASAASASQGSAGRAASGVTTLTTLEPIPPDTETTTASPPIQFIGQALSAGPTTVTVAELEQLTQSEVTVYDHYWEEHRRYSGPLLRDLVAKFAPTATTIEMTAIDDYRATFEAAEWDAFNVLLATRDEGSRMSVSDKGPIRIVIHHDDLEEIRPLRPKWIWQITEIRFQ